MFQANRHSPPTLVTGYLMFDAPPDHAGLLHCVCWSVPVGEHTSTACGVWRLGLMRQFCSHCHPSLIPGGALCRAHQSGGRIVEQVDQDIHDSKCDHGARHHRSRKGGKCKTIAQSRGAGAWGDNCHRRREMSHNSRCQFGRTGARSPDNRVRPSLREGALAQFQSANHAVIRIAFRVIVRKLY